MDKAKAAINDFMHKSGKNDTTIHEVVAPAVQHETIKPHQHEEVNTAVDREVHQDHYHRTVQPVKDREVLPETHTHNLAAVQHKEIDHRDISTTQRALAADQSAFKNERVIEGTTTSKSTAPVIGGEHVHHHIHETIQPVVHKETIQPNVVHTTVPIHEVHHNAAKHHDTTALPAMTMSEFKQHGGVLSGREERFDEFKGEPKQIGGTLSGLKDGVTKRDSAHNDDLLRKNASHGDFTTGTTTTTGTTGATGLHQPTGEHKIGSTGTHGNTTTTTHKPSLMQKLNPKIDADGDGKKGFMD